MNYARRWRRLLALPGALLVAASLWHSASASVQAQSAGTQQQQRQQQQQQQNGPFLSQTDDRGVVPVLVFRGPDGSVRLFVPVFVQGEGPFPFALDTGASSSVIDRDLVDALGLTVSDETQEAFGVSGRLDVGTLTLRRWQLGSVRLQRTRVGVVDLPDQEGQLPIAGLLGSDVLSRFGVIAVDYDGGRLILNPNLGS